jgi:hypothetical protein
LSSRIRGSARLQTEIDRISAGVRGTAGWDHAGPKPADQRSALITLEAVVNSLVQVHMPATYFGVYQELRGELMAILSDDDLAVRVGGTSASLGALCREIGEIEHSYVESFRTFRQDFGYRNPDPLLETSVAALTGWYAELDTELAAATEAISEEDIASRRIVRNDFDSFSPLPSVQLDIYREALLIFYGKVSVYLQAMGKALPGHWEAWIG